MSCKWVLGEPCMDLVVSVVYHVVSRGQHILRIPVISITESAQWRSEGDEKALVDRLYLKYSIPLVEGAGTFWNELSVG